MEISNLYIKKILDLATGLGQFIPYLLDQIQDLEEIIGVDTCQRSIEAAEKNFKNDKRVSFLNLDAKELPFADHYFDGISLNNSLHHFEDIPGVFKEAKRILSPKGYLIFNEMTSDSGQSQSQQSHILLHHWFADIDRLLKRYHDHTYSSEKIIELITANGFDIIEKEIYNHEIPNPKDAKMIESYINTIRITRDRLTQKIPHSILDEAENIVNHLSEHGYSPARAIMIIAQKSKEQI